MRKLKVINSYTDKELAKNMVVGFEFETSEERAKVLIDKDFCIDITEDVIVNPELVIKTEPIIQNESIGLIVEQPKRKRRQSKTK